MFCVIINVKYLSRYTFGKPVEGIVDMKITATKDRNEPRKAVELKFPVSKYCIVTRPHISSDVITPYNHLQLSCNPLTASLCHPYHVHQLQICICPAVKAVLQQDPYSQIISSEIFKFLKFAQRLDFL